MNKMIRPLKADLREIKKDWEKIFDPNHPLNDPVFLAKFARDILNLDADAQKAMKCEKVKEEAEMVHYLLTTPWGAPFASPITLLDAAKFYSQDHHNSELLHLVHGFAHYSAAQEAPLFNFFDAIDKEIKL